MPVHQAKRRNRRAIKARRVHFSVVIVVLPFDSGRSRPSSKEKLTEPDTYLARKPGAPGAMRFLLVEDNAELAEAVSRGWC